MTSVIGGALSVSLAGIFALNLRTAWIPMLVSYAIGAMLGAVFLEILPHAFEKAPNVESISATLLFGLLLFFVLENSSFGGTATAIIVRCMRYIPRLIVQMR